MAANLSDRIIDSSKEVLAKITQTDVVQKMLMTGDLSGKNKSVALRVYKDLVDLTPFSQKLFEDAANLSGITPEEKGFFQKMSDEFIPVYNKYLEQLKAAVGPVPDDVLSAPISQSLIQYQKLFTEQLEKGLILQFLVISMAGYAIPLGMYAHLSGNPSYTENDLAKLFTCHGMGLEKAFGAVKAFIDNRANEVTPELESELKALCYKFHEFDLDLTTKVYEA